VEGVFEGYNATILGKNDFISIFFIAHLHILTAYG
jgi:hypothetical protein